MNQVTREQKETTTKILAIVGFVAIILLGVWLAVTVVSVIPNAFSSLASIADSVYNYEDQQPLTVATKNSVMNANESFIVSWTDVQREGVYSFSYACTEGVAVSARDTSGQIVNVACDTALALGSATTLDVLVESEKQRFTDVAYAITFTPTDTDAEAVTKNAEVTIVNATIPTGTVVATDETDEESDETPAEGEGQVAGESTDTPVTVVPGPTVTEEVIYAIPVSDPNGTIDLQVTYLGVGTLSGNTFVKSATIDRNMKGAFRFEVKNIGTKTADNWSYDADLPSDISYASGKQVALKPNERAVITISFEGISKTGVEKFGADVTASGDIRTSNNDFSWAVEIVE